MTQPTTEAGRAAAQEHAALTRAIEKAHQQRSLCDDFRCNGITDHDQPIREAAATVHADLIERVIRHVKEALTADGARVKIDYHRAMLAVERVEAALLQDDKEAGG